MALGATIYRFIIDLADVDRGVFEPLELRLAQHPSESVRYFVVRLLARCLEHREGLEVTRGVSDTELPAIVVRDLQGSLSHWIEVGAPAPKRVHKATARAEDVAVYIHRKPDQVINELRLAELRRAAQVRLIWFDEALLDGLEAALARSNTWAISLSDGTLYVDAGGTSLSGAVHRAILDQAGLEQLVTASRSAG